MPIGWAERKYNDGAWRLQKPYEISKGTTAPGQRAEGALSPLRPSVEAPLPLLVNRMSPCVYSPSSSGFMPDWGLNALSSSPGDKEGRGRCSGRGLQRAAAS